MLKVVFNKAAAKKFDKLTPELKGRICKAIEALKINPLLGKRLHGELAGTFRLRIGDYRIIYSIDNEIGCIIVHVIGSRGDVYK